ncbi:hypothetical protein MKY04_09170 [Lysinibacillus telephonicus]|uniref:hypothetical protein n=1 Tax=Lysinibacillus telephonicus TaxID=1714840 RepID=UPI0031FCB26D
MKNFQHSFKRMFYIEQLKQLKITEVDGVPVQDLSDQELKHALTIARLKEGA